MRARLADGLAAAVVLLWPFLYLFPYVLPIDGQFLAVGNDFQVLYFGYKAALLDSLAHFDLPWWSPSESGGFPFYSSPFTETFYPLNLLLAAYYKAVDGYRVLDHQRFTVFGISIFALGLYCWLRSLRFNVRTAMAAAMVLGVSFKLTELLRFPNAMHTAAWYPWVLFFMTRLAASTSRRSQAVHATLLAGALLCMVTGGYPYYVVYSPWLFGPYLLMLLVPRWSKALLHREPAEARRVLPAFAMAGLAVALACAPYFYKMSALMKQTVDRGGQSFDYSTEFFVNYQDTVGSWLFPPAAQFEGWYYFGIINVMLVILAVALRPRNPLPWVLLAWLALVSYVTYVKSSALFWFLWHYVPPYASLRVWGRMNVILIPILAWLVAIAYQHFESLVAGREPGQESRRSWRPLVMLCAIAGAILATQFYVRAHGWHDEYWGRYFVGWINLGYSVSALLDYLKLWGLRTGLTPAQMIAAGERVFMAAAVISFLGLAFMMLLAPWFRRGGAYAPRIVLAVTVAIAAIDMWAVGPWAWAWRVLPAGTHKPYDIARRNAESFTVPRIDLPTMYPQGAFTVGSMPNWYFERYVRFRREGEREPDAMKQLLGMVDGRKVFFSERIDHASIQAFLDDARRFDGVERVTAYTGDEMSISVNAPRAGYLSFIDNWDPDWTAAVDATAVPIERLFGTFKSVPVRAGAHTVDFAYRPFGAWR